MTQFEIYVRKRIASHKVSVDEVNLHVSRLLESFKLEDSGASLMGHTWNFLVAMEGLEASYEFLVDKFNETKRSGRWKEITKPGLISYEDSSLVSINFIHACILVLLY